MNILFYLDKMNSNKNSTSWYLELTSFFLNYSPLLLISAKVDLCVVITCHSIKLRYTSTSEG